MSPTNPPPPAPRENQKPGARRPSRAEQGWPRWSLWGALALLLLVLLFVGMPGGNTGEELSYKELFDRVRANAVAEMEIDTESHRIEGMFKSGEHFTVKGPTEIP